MRTKESGWDGGKKKDVIKSEEPKDSDAKGDGRGQPDRGYPGVIPNNVFFTKNAAKKNKFRYFSLR